MNEKNTGRMTYLRKAFVLFHIPAPPEFDVVVIWYDVITCDTTFSSTL